MKTSYFRLSANAPGAVSIAFREPWYFKGPRYYVLAPPEELLKDYLDKLVGEDEYRDVYECRVLGPLDARVEYEKLCLLASPAEAILLCHCAPGEFCHRRLVAAWFEQRLGVVVPEIEPAGAATGSRTESLFKT